MHLIGSQMDNKIPKSSRRRSCHGKTVLIEGGNLPIIFSYCILNISFNKEAEIEIG